MACTSSSSGTFFRVINVHTGCPGRARRHLLYSMLAAWDLIPQRQFIKALTTFRYLGSIRESFEFFVHNFYEFAVYILAGVTSNTDTNCELY